MPLRSNDQRQDFEVAPNILGVTPGESVKTAAPPVAKSPPSVFCEGHWYR